MTERLVKNKVLCKLCDDIIQSYTIHDFKMCKCGAVGVDGGLDYARRIGVPDNIRDLSEWIIED